MTFRMLETFEYGSSVPIEASEPEALDEVRARLVDVLHMWEEEALCASWTSSTPWWLWACAHQPVASDTRRWCWGCDDPSDAEREELRRLADEAGGWWVWLDDESGAPGLRGMPEGCPCDECREEQQPWHSGFRFVPLGIWREAYAAYQSAGNDISAGEAWIRRSMGDRECGPWRAQPAATQPDDGAC